jgi:multiple sugar transport system permease protein
LGPAWTGILFLALILGFPLLRGLQLSFTDTNTLNPTESTYVGLANYSNLFTSSSFFPALIVTIIYTLPPIKFFMPIKKRIVAGLSGGVVKV